MINQRYDQDQSTIPAIISITLTDTITALSRTRLPGDYRHDIRGLLPASSVRLPLSPTLSALSALASGLLT